MKVTVSEFIDSCFAVIASQVDNKVRHGMEFVPAIEQALLESPEAWRTRFGLLDQIRAKVTADLTEHMLTEPARITLARARAGEEFV